MLEGLEQIDWERLTHAYGSASDVPEAIRDLRSPDAEVRKNAADGLANTIFHQHDRYRASAPAVPFLFEVLEAPDTADRAQIIELLSRLAAGYAEYHLPFGFDPAQEFAPAEALGEAALAEIRAAEPSEEEDDWEPDRLAPWHWRGLAVHASRVVTLLRPEATEATVAALCRAAETVPLYAADHIFRALLTVVIPEPTSWRTVDDPSDPNGVLVVYLDPQRLTEMQRQALQAIGRNPVWETTDPHASILDVCVHFGLPIDTEKFRRLLAEAGL